MSEMAQDERPQAAQPSLLKWVLAVLCLAALALIVQILNGNGGEESGRILLTLGAAAVALVMFRVGRSLAGAEDDFSWFGYVLCAVAVTLLLITVMAIWQAMDDEDYVLALLSLLAVLYFSLGARAGQRLMMSDHDLSWVGTLTLVVTAVGFAAAQSAIWGSTDDSWYDNYKPWEYATVLSLFTVALGHTSMLLRTAAPGDRQEIAAIRAGTIGLVLLLATLISIDVISLDDSVDPKAIGVLAVLYALGSLALPLMRRIFAAPAAVGPPVAQAAAVAPPLVDPAPPVPIETRPVSVRPAYASDADAIAAIYNQGIEERQATFQTRHHGPGELELKTEQRGGHLIVAERDGVIAGWAGWSGYDDPADYYSGIAECAVYVARDARCKGVGSELLEGLAYEAPRFGVHKLLAKVFTSNEPSLALFRRNGFREVGTHLRHGRLEGEWKDVIVLERLLGDA
jgi:phosphinothricin acetyltransferase